MYDPHHPVQREIDVFLASIFPDAEVRNWVLDVFAEMIEPVDHRNNNMYIWLGTGSNGRTSLQHLLEYTCGSYIAKVDKEILTAGGYFRHNYSEQAAHRHLLILEDGTDCQVRLENMKRLFNLGKGIEQPPCGDLHVICNEVPRFEFGDNSLMRGRVFIIPFTQTFKVDFVEHAQFHWPPYFWQRLLHIYTRNLDRVKLEEEGLQSLIPRAVRMATEHCYSVKNSFERFADEHIRVVGIDNTTKITDIMTAYQSWMSKQVNPGRRLKKDEVYDALLGGFTLKIEGGVFKNLVIV
jgi:hypothetical protein